MHHWSRACCMAAGAVAAAGCDTDVGGVPAGKGDTVVHDVDATIQPSQPMPEAGAYDDSPFGVVTGGYDAAYGYGDASASIDGYAPLAVCAHCACEAGTYCFGGGTGHTTFSGNCGASAGGLSVGCQPLPPACSSAATCDCIFNAIAHAGVSCYPECVGKGQLTVYCPAPVAKGRGELEGSGAPLD